MIGRFLQWWFGHLAALLPFSRGSDFGQWLEITVGAERVRASLSDHRELPLMDVERAQEAQLQAELSRVAATLDRSRVRCRIWVDASEVLGREIELPVAAEENLREVLSFEMARKTPFRAQDVYFDALITDRDAARHRITLQLNVVPRRTLDFVTSVLANWSLEAISSPRATALAQRHQQAVFSFQGAAFKRRSYTGLNVTLACAALAVAGLCAWLPLDAQQQTAKQLQAEQQRARVEATQAMALRDEFDAVQRASTFLAQARSARPAMVQVIEELTRALPDNTFLTRVMVNGDEVNLHGNSKAASELIAILDQLSLLDAVRFASPVTRDTAHGGERFHIVAKLAAHTDTQGLAPGTGS